MPMALPSLSLVLPCRDPAPGWAANVVAGMAGLRQLLPGVDLELRVVDDGSRSGFAPVDLAPLSELDCAVELIRQTRNGGKGSAVRRGLRGATATVTAFTDVDLPYGPEGVAAVYRAVVEEGADLALGHRDASYERAVRRHRARLSRWARALTSRLLPEGVRDAQCGVKAFSRRGSELLLTTRVDRYLFDLELLLLARRRPSLRISTVPVVLRPGVVLSRMGPLTIVREGLSFLGLLVRHAGRG